MKKWIIPVVIVAAGAAGFAVYQKQHADRQPENIIASNGRLELERIDVATLYAGRVKSMNVDEGSEVKAGDVLAELSSDTTSGRVEEAQAGELAAKEMVQRAQAGVKQAQEAVAQTVERAQPHRADIHGNHRAEPRLHFFGGLVGERYRQNIVHAGHAVLQQPGNAGG